jgi:hypothetical protein
MRKALELINKLDEAESTKVPRSHAGKLNSYLEGRGFTGESTTENEVRRYVKKGFYDGDYPNAHQSVATINHHKYEKSDPKQEEREELRSHLTSLGYKHTIYPPHKWRKSEQDNYSKGKHFVAASYDKKKFIVSHSHETTKPDLEFERSGRGHGQII